MIAAADLRAVAARFERFGALQQAEQLYRQSLEYQPDDAELWARLGRTCRALGRYAEAVASLQRALELQPGRAEFHNELGTALVEHGRLDEAIDCYRAATRFRTDYAEAHDNEGIARLRQRDPHGAAHCHRHALHFKPDNPIAHFNLANALAVLGEQPEAAENLRRAVQLRPDFTQAWIDLGDVLKDLGESDEAAACYERAAELRPEDPDLLGALGILRMQRGELTQAVACYERALSLRPDFVAVYSNLGLALLAEGRLEEARLSFEQALYLQPELAEVHNNLGLALLNQGRAEEARASFEQALTLRPELTDAQNNLSLALEALGRPDDALLAVKRALLGDPHHRGALTNLGNAYKDEGRVADAIATYRRVLVVDPDDAPVHSNLLLAMQYQSGMDPQDILEEARRYARQHAGPLSGTTEPRSVRCRSGRRLRIGYVSPDFREHPVVYFLEPILAAHDHRGFEIFCYADVPIPDAVTRRLQDCADHWRSLVGLADSQAAEMIHQDAIDILVDLAGHTAGNRLRTFARKPAPLQVSYLGYLGTTGLASIDYYLTDAHADPPELADAHYQERLIRLPECGFCYSPGPAPEVSPAVPAEQSGQVTFGSLNNVAKLSDEVLAVWSQVLSAVPGSVLFLGTGVGGHAADRIRDILARHGIAPERLRLAGRTASRYDYLTLYHGIDIGLDPFPYNGVTTTCDALWMGIPTVTLAGRSGAARQGVRFLRNVGLDELIAESPEEYVRIATSLAGDLPRLTAWHSDLRERMRRSPLRDANRLTRNLERAYLGMCEASRPSPNRVDDALTAPA
jgi:predicted O-linked N-acetylglucosamine transferase (SPINDLY family)